MVILHKDLAGDFEQFCRANPQPCPLLAVLPAGCKVPTELAPEADITTDLPKYRIYRHGRMTEEVRIRNHPVFSSIKSLSITNASILLLGD